MTLPMHPVSQEKSPAKQGEKAKPRAFRDRGKLVCLLEEMKRLHGADVAPVHEHVLGYRLAGDLPEEAMRYFTVLRTPQSKALFEDQRFSKRTLILTGRVFPETAILEVSGRHWIRDGKVYNVYYWCDVCSIRGIDPGSCDCCQEDVALREELMRTPVGKRGGNRHFDPATRNRNPLGKVLPAEKTPFTAEKHLSPVDRPRYKEGEEDSGFDRGHPPP